MIGDWLHLSTDTRSVDLFCLFDGLTSTQNSEDRTQGSQCDTPGMRVFQLGKVARVFLHSNQAMSRVVIAMKCSLHCYSMSVSINVNYFHLSRINQSWKSFRTQKVSFLIIAHVPYHYRIISCHLVIHVYHLKPIVEWRTVFKSFLMMIR